MKNILIWRNLSNPDRTQFSWWIRIHLYRRIEISAMKTFEAIRMQLTALSVHQSDQDFRFSWKNITIISLFIQHVIATVTFLFFEANSFDEYSEASFSMMTELLVIISYSAFVWERKSIFKLIDDSDNFTVSR